MNSFWTGEIEYRALDARTLGIHKDMARALSRETGEPFTLNVDVGPQESRNITFTPDGREAYWRVTNPALTERSYHLSALTRAMVTAGDWGERVVVPGAGGVPHFMNVAYGQTSPVRAR